MSQVCQLSAIPDILLPHVERWFERAHDHGAMAGLLRQFSHDGLESLRRVVASSEFAAAALLTEPHLLAQLGSKNPLPFVGLDALDDFAGAHLRRWRRHHMVAIVWREVTGQIEVVQTLEELSALADRAIQHAVNVARAELRPMFGEPMSEGALVEFIVLGMGKLGGGELNFSSDVDLIFLYGQGGQTSGPRVLDNDEYFTRLGRAVIRLLDANTADGFAFRVDLRLRPFGESGPIAVSLASLENYLQEHGRDWERYAWVKARPIVGAERYAATDRAYVRPFVYRRYLDFGVFDSLRDMKALIAREVGRRDLRDDLKLGSGGIREIEFIAQSFQLVRGGSDPRLQNASILKVLPVLRGEKLMRSGMVDELLSAYTVLRKAENAVQMIRDAQTHALPVDEADQARVALIMNMPDWAAAHARIEAAQSTVARHFDALVFGAGASRATPVEDSVAWLASSATPVLAELHARKFNAASAEPTAAALESYRGSPAYRRLDASGRRRIHRVFSAVLEYGAARPGAHELIARFIRVIEAIGARSAYLALLNEQPMALERLIQVCEISGFLARQIAEFPLLLDELIDARIFDEPPSREEFARQLELRMQKVATDEPEREVEALRQFQKAAIFAVALSDLTGRLPLMKVSDRLTDIAELIVQRCMALAWTQMTAVHGVPRCGPTSDRLRTVNVAVIGYGKLGGLELGYGSDLDLVFVHDSRGEIQMTDAARPQDNGIFFLRLGQRIMHLLTMHSAAGRLYDVDMRLRPNGKGGFLITGLDAFERYQREEAWTWEHQALLRARAIGGDAGLCSDFENIRRRVLEQSVERDTLRDDIAQMRSRMRRELAKSRPGEFDIKQDAGGIADIEFLVQYWVLAHARDAPELTRYSDNIRQLDALAARDVVPLEVTRELAEIYKTFRATVHRLTLEDPDARIAPATEFEAARGRVSEIWRTTFGPELT